MFLYREGGKTLKHAWLMSHVCALTSDQPWLDDISVLLYSIRPQSTIGLLTQIVISELTQSHRFPEVAPEDIKIVKEAKVNYQGFTLV